VHDGSLLLYLFLPLSCELLGFFALGLLLAHLFLLG